MNYINELRNKMNLIDKVFVLTMVVLQCKLHRSTVTRMKEEKRQQEEQQRQLMLMEFFKNSFPTY